MSDSGSCVLRDVTLCSPVGEILLSGCEKGVHTINIKLGTDKEDSARCLLMDWSRVDYCDVFIRCLNSHSDGTHSLQRIHCVHPVGQSEMSPELERCVDWLQCYFMKPESVGALPLPAFHHPLMQSDSFKAHVLRTLFKEVGLGKTVSYKQLAEMIGNPKAARAVGSAMKNNPIPLIVPCHRVLRSSGDSGSYMGGKGDDIKVWLLAHEKKALELNASKTEKSI